MHLAHWNFRTYADSFLHNPTGKLYVPPDIHLHFSQNFPGSSRPVGGWGLDYPLRGWYSSYYYLCQKTQKILLIFCGRVRFLNVSVRKLSLSI
jgi:hypothetical protein